MKVWELISRLKDMPQESEVCYNDNEYGVTKVDEITFESAWFLGDVYTDKTLDHKVVLLS